MDAQADKILQGGSGCVVAALIGVLITGAARAILYLIHPSISFELREEWGVLLIHSLVFAAPFGLYAVANVGQMSIWIAALILTVILWGGLFAYGGLGGANIGLGWLMIASPLGIAAGGPALVSAVRRLGRK